MLLQMPLNKIQDQIDELNVSSSILITKTRSTARNLKQLCFICNEQRNSDIAVATAD